NMANMFKNCSKLTSLDLSNFDTSKVTDMSSMFFSCSDLTTIYVSSTWNAAKVRKSNSMFSGCSSLVGGAGTIYNSTNKTDKTYACIDGGGSAPGYFTDISKKSA
ncbi:MAG: BspA family leucine-rich repeat surface protein, partial [Eubacteriales bacterium]|nr:BspA family leucine-rich repeat surface protein [Eubacteriales bacterium]